jgi:FkbM family methyltransferase
MREGDTVVDIGANKGYFSLLAANRVGSSGRVISYEPLPRNLLDLEATIRAGRHANWIVRPVGISKATGAAVLHSPVGTGGSGWGTLEPQAMDRSDDQPIETATLSEEFTRNGLLQIHLLKMDIQGHELSALLGAEDLLHTGRITSLLVEVHPRILPAQDVARIFELMAGAGYAGRLLDESARTLDEWRRLGQHDPSADIRELLPPISRSDDPRVSALRSYKVLWERPTAP